MKEDAQIIQIPLTVILEVAQIIKILLVEPQVGDHPSQTLPIEPHSLVLQKEILLILGGQ